MPGVGDFGVTAIPGRAGRWIRVGQWLNGDGYDDFQHAFVVVEEGRGVEAQPTGAAYVDLTGWPRAVYYNCPEESREAVAAAAVSLIGTPYSWADYFALAAVRLHLDAVARPLRKYVHDSGHLICSQLVDLAYQMGGVQLYDDGRLPGDVTPADLYQLIAAQRSLPEPMVRFMAKQNG